MTHPQDTLATLAQELSEVRAERDEARAWLRQTETVVERIQVLCEARMKEMDYVINQAKLQDPFNPTAILTAGAHRHGLKSVLAIIVDAARTGGGKP